MRPSLLAVVCAVAFALAGAAATVALRIARGPTPGTAADTANLVRVAKQQSPRPDSARITKLIMAGDTARVTVFTREVNAIGDSRATEQDLPFARTTGRWRLDDTRGSSDRVVDAIAPFKVP
jgi:hypothetical protein